MDCVFCKIVDGEIPSKKVYEDGQILAIYDLEPQAPVHVLFIPKEHIGSADDLTEENPGLFRIFMQLSLKSQRSWGLKTATVL